MHGAARLLSTTGRAMGDHERDSLRRCLHWSGCANVRDLGGYQVLEGGETTWGILVRADSVEQLTADGRASLAAYGIKTIIDLRHPTEMTDTFRGRVGIDLFSTPVSYHNVWLEDRLDQAHGIAVREAGEMTEVYKLILTRFQWRIGLILAAIANAPGGIVVSCRFGRDRTGLISALLLALCDVSHDDIAGDYALSDAYLARSALDPQYGAQARYVVATVIYPDRAPRWRIRAILEWIEVEFGGLDAYCLAAGLEANELCTLRSRFRRSYDAVTGR